MLVEKVFFFILPKKWDAVLALCNPFFGARCGVILFLGE
jgi:hypothetical protein